MKFIILSDIHANLSALEAVFTFVERKYEREELKFIILGDFIDYGPRPNEVIALLKQKDLFSVISGNHEQAILLNDISCFSSKRGVDSLRYTASILNNDSMKFISSSRNGLFEFTFENRKVLLVHGDLSNVYWGKMNRTEMEKDIYTPFDFVLSGHTHIPHFHEIFHEDDRSNFRNKKKTIFINVGSVGQPRNHNNMAQFGVIDFCTEMVCFEKTVYEINKELSYFSDKVDSFYKERLILGI